MQDTIHKHLIPVPTGLLQVQNFPASTSSIKPLVVSLIVPTYNEARNIQQLIATLVRLLNQLVPEKYELIIVDDNSPDKTWKLALELIAIYPQLRVMRRDRQKGLATAVIRGWQVARGEILGVIDADLQHPPEILVKLCLPREKNGRK